MAITLQGDAVTVMNVGSGPAKLLHEFFTAYFSGVTRTLGGAEYFFPKAVVQVGQGGNGEMREPEIRIIQQSLGGQEYAWDEGKKIFEKVQLVIATRAPQTQDAKAVSMGLADLVYGLLQLKAETLPLAQKGIYEIQMRPPRPIQNEDFQLYMLVGQMKLIVEA